MKRAPSSAPRAGHTLSPPSWRVWSALGVVYVLWGSTYLAIRVMVEDVPPLLGAGVRFASRASPCSRSWPRAGAACACAPPRLPPRALVGLLLPAGGNGLVTVAEQDVPGGLAALLIASVPLWVVLLRSTIGRERVAPRDARRSRGRLLRPGGCSCSRAAGPPRPRSAASCSSSSPQARGRRGSFLSPRLSMPSDPLVSTAWQMVAGGAALLVGALITGEPNDLHLAHASAKSLLAFAYLVLAGSWVAFTAYAWLLQNVPISKVATYAYVNPLVAVLLGWALLSEQLTVGTAAGAGLIVVSVAAIVSRESAPPEDADPEPVAVPRPRPCRGRALHQATRCRRLSFLTQP